MDRDIRMPIASRISAEEMVRSKGFPSSIACAASATLPPSHCDGNRVPMMNIQITGSHRAGEVFGSRAGSKYRSATSDMNQSSSAREGFIVPIRLPSSLLEAPADL